MGSGAQSDIADVPAAASAWHAEYRYRQLFPMTHEQYLDEPLESIQWMLRIQEVEDRIQKRRSKEES